MTNWKISGTRTAPVADRDVAWSGKAARDALQEWAGGDEFDPVKMRKGFLLYDADADDGIGSYKLPYCNVLDGKLTIIPRGVFALAGSRGVEAVTGIDDDLRQKLRDAVTVLYERIADVLDDDSIVSPFAEDASKHTGEGDSAAHSASTPGTGASTPPAATVPAQVRDSKRNGPATFKRSPTYDKIIGDRTVVGYPTIYGNVDDGGDIIMPGAYTKTLLERGDRLRWLWQHSWEHPPIAAIDEVVSVDRGDLPAKVTSKFPEATGGLRVKRTYLQTQRADEVLAGIAAGALDEMSIGYDAIAVEYPDNLVVGGRAAWRILNEVRLWEFSDVLWGMNSATTNAKSLLTEPDDTLYELLKSSGRLSAVVAAYEQEKARAMREAERLQWQQRRRQLQLQLAQRL